MDKLTLAAVRLRARLSLVGAKLREERGDVPGWVMITMMTAALVMAIWFLALPWLQDMMGNAESTVNFTDSGE